MVAAEAKRECWPNEYLQCWPNEYLQVPVDLVNELNPFSKADTTQQRVDDDMLEATHEPGDA